MERCCSYNNEAAFDYSFVKLKHWLLNIKCVERSLQEILLSDTSLCRKFFCISYLKIPLKSYCINWQSESFYAYLDYFLAWKCSRPCSEEVDNSRTLIWGVKEQKIIQSKRHADCLNLYFPVCGTMLPFLLV